MQKLTQSQTLQTTLSPQQIQFIKLLQIPTAELETRIEEELEVNPALEEGKEEDFYASTYEQGGENERTEERETSDDYDDDMPLMDDHRTSLEEISMGDYLSDDVSGYKMQGDGYEEEDKEMPLPMQETLMDSLMDQLGYLNLTEEQHAIGEQLIGSIDADGYIRRDLEAIVNDLAFSQNILTDVQEVTEVLHMVQRFDPAGIAARDLQECLILQLQRKPHEKDAQLASRILALCFDEFIKKHYHKIQRKLGLSDEDIRDAIHAIIKLNPKPGEVESTYSAGAQYLMPDFIVREEEGRLEISLNARNAPELRISRSYADMIDTYERSRKRDEKMRQTMRFVKQKLDAAKWFIDAIKQRQDTLLRTMDAILRYQYDFFLTGDESRLRPMILKDIALKIGMDISTVSRVASSKVVQTDFGIYPLKYFFSESISTDSGEEVSSKEVKHVLKTLIDGEDKRKPLSDDRLEKLLNIKGYNIARRTVAKYREQLGIPVARLRKEL